MDDRDPWKVYDELSDDEKDEVLSAVSAQRNGRRQISDAEVNELADLLKELEADRKRRELGELLREFLPSQE
jgi:uncharacterized membrane protein